MRILKNTIILFLFFANFNANSQSNIPPPNKIINKKNLDLKEINTVINDTLIKVVPVYDTTQINVEVTKEIINYDTTKVKVKKIKEINRKDRDKSGLGINFSYLTESIDETSFAPNNAVGFGKKSRYIPEILMGIEWFIKNSKLSIGLQYGFQKSKFDYYSGDINNLKDQLYALSIGNQIGNSPFFIKASLGAQSYNYDTVDNYELTYKFYGSAGIQVFIGRGISKNNNRITAEAFINTAGSIGYGLGFLF